MKSVIENKIRLEYIDHLKGFAIFLMVMGHFLAWSTPFEYNFNDPNIMFVWNLIYSFHMPLFFFISGYLINLNKKEWNTERRLYIIKRRLKTLILPSITFLIIRYLIIGVWEFDWFIISLFWIYCFFIISNILSSLFNNVKYEILIHCIIFIILSALSKIIHNDLFEFLEIRNSVLNYPYFVLGYFVCKFSFDTYIKEKNYVYSIALLLFVILFYIRNYKPYNLNLLYPFPFYCLKYPLAICGIIICWKYATDYIPNNRISNYFNILGKNSLSVYLLSRYIIPWYPELGNYFVTSNIYTSSFASDYSHVTSIFTQLISGIFFTTIVCMICLFMKSIIRKSKFWNLIMFGE